MILYATLLASFTHCQNHKTTSEHLLAAVIVPVASISTQPLSTFGLSKISYDTIPLAPAKGSWNSCPRTFQLLYNDIVWVVENRNNESRIVVPSVRYTSGNKTCNEFWINSAQLHPLITIPDAALFIPQQYNPNKNNRTQHNCIILTQPLKDPKTKRTYSAGTRFVYRDKTASAYTAYAYRPEHHDFVFITIPASSCIESKERSHEESRQLFVQLLQQWAHAHPAIPYVWGGSSYNKQYPDCTYHLDVVLANGKKLPCYQLATPIYPYSGFDCSGLIMRAAHIAELPYDARNTQTIKQTLSPLAQGEALQAGDIIHIHGHVLCISDVEKNLVIEAGSQERNCTGTVREVHCSKLFEHAATLQDIVNAHHTKRPLKRVDKDGNVLSAELITIVTFASIWK
jgi:cell wall-associated NlpC family hydrolase